MAKKPSKAPPAVTKWPREIWPVGEIKPAGYNPRRISPEALEGLKASLSAFGELQPVVVNRRTGHIVGGHQRFEALVALGEKEIEVVVADFDEATEKAANISLNNPAIQGTWDNDLLDELLAEFRSSDTEFSGFAQELRFDELIESFVSPLESIDADEAAESGVGEVDKPATLSEKYTTRVNPPVYEPNGPAPAEFEMYDQSRTNELLRELEAVEQDLPPDLFEFLVAAAHRHTVFNFRLIANYYAHAPATIQRLMENSALVIIDFDKAIERGFVQMTKHIGSLVADAAGEIEDEP